MNFHLLIKLIFVLKVQCTIIPKNQRNHRESLKLLFCQLIFNAIPKAPQIPNNAINTEYTGEKSLTRTKKHNNPIITIGFGAILVILPLL